MATNVWPLHFSDTGPRPAPPIPPAMPAKDARARPRSLSVGRAAVRPLGQRHADEARLLDLSIYGCRLAVTAAHGAGDRVWLRFDGGWPIAATVVWAEAEADGSRMGCRFDDAIPGATMRELTRTLI